MSNDLLQLAMTAEQFKGLYNYWIVIFLMMTGFFIVISRKNMIKTVIGLNIFQTSVFLLYITMGKVNNGTAPILRPEDAHHDDHSHDHAGEADHASQIFLDQIADHTPAQNVSAGSEPAIALEALAETGTNDVIYSNPLPSVLMLTAIVVGIATTALALALIVRIREDYGTIEEDEILILDRES